MDVTRTLKKWQISGRFLLEHYIFKCSNLSNQQLNDNEVCVCWGAAFVLDLIFLIIHVHKKVNKIII